MAIIKYYQSYGKCGGGEVMELDIDLSDEEQDVYDREIQKIKVEILRDNPDMEEDDIYLDDDDIASLNSIPELQDALERAAIEAMEYEISEYCNEEFSEALGYNEMDEDELYELVNERDPYTLKYFGLENATDEELENWILDEIPTVAEFKEDFKPDTSMISVRFGIEN